LTQKELAERSGLDVGTVLRLAQLKLLPEQSIPRPQRGRWRIFGSEALLLARVAAAYTQLGAPAVDAAPLLLTLLAMPESERAAYAARTILVRYARGTMRVDFVTEGKLPGFLNIDPLTVPLTDLIAEPEVPAR